MTATYSDEITNVISNLRSTIYNSEEFVRKFTEYMNRKVKLRMTDEGRRNSPMSIQ